MNTKGISVGKRFEVAWQAMGHKQEVCKVVLEVLVIRENGSDCV